MDLKTAVYLAAQYGGTMSITVGLPEGHFTGYKDVTIEGGSRSDNFTMVTRHGKRETHYSEVISWWLRLAAKGVQETEHTQLAVTQPEP